MGAERSKCRGRKTRSTRKDEEIERSFFRDLLFGRWREIVGTLAAVGQGDLPPRYVHRALKDCGASGDVDGRGVDVPGAPAHGLTLAHVDFETHRRETHGRETSMP